MTGVAGFGGRMYRCAMMLRCCLTDWASVLSLGLTAGVVLVIAPADIASGGGGATAQPTADVGPPAAITSGPQQPLTAEWTDSAETSGGQL